MKIYHSSKNGKYTTLSMKRDNDAVFLTLSSGSKESEEFKTITMKLDVSELSYIKEVLSIYIQEMIKNEEINTRNSDRYRNRFR